MKILNDWIHLKMVMYSKRIKEINFFGRITKNQQNVFVVLHEYSSSTYVYIDKYTPKIKIISFKYENSPSQLSMLSMLFHENELNVNVSNSVKPIKWKGIRAVCQKCLCQKKCRMQFLTHRPEKKNWVICQITQFVKIFWELFSF